MRRGEWSTERIDTVQGCARRDVIVLGFHWRALLLREPWCCALGRSTVTSAAKGVTLPASSAITYKTAGRVRNVLATDVAAAE